MSYDFPGITANAIREAENCSTKPSKLAVNMLAALFTHEELAAGNCTKASRKDIVLLDQTKIQAIRGKVYTIVAHINFIMITINFQLM